MLLCIALTPTPATAQDDPVPPPPVRSTVDANNVDLTSGKALVASVDVAIGPDSHHGLSFTRQWVDFGWRFAGMPTLSGNTSYPIVSFQGASVAFKPVSGGGYEPVLANGATLNASRTQFTGPDGTKIVFEGSSYTYQHMDTSLGRPVTVTFPDGVVWTYHYNQTSYTYSSPPPTLPPECYGSNPPAACGAIVWEWQQMQGQVFSFSRLSSITSSTGYQIKLGYASDNGGQSTIADWLRLSSATAINNRVEYCSPTAACTPASTWPKATYTSTTVTNPLGQATTYSYTSGRLSGIKPPGASSNVVSYSYSGSKVVSAQRTGHTWNYSYGTGTTTATDPLGKTRTVTYNPNTSAVASDRNELGQTTRFTYCGANDANCPQGLLKTVTAPEGNSVRYAYDERGNVTSTTYGPKTDLGGTPLVTRANYPGSCTSSNQKICNKPVSTTDANQNTTHYNWNATHGGLNWVRAPADASGVRPETRYSYAARQARYLSGASSYTTSGNIYVPVAVSSCRIGASCNGTANERETVVAYPASTTPNNLQPTSITSRAGNNTLSTTTTLAYDNYGRLQTIDGPLAGNADVERIFHDKAGRLIGRIGADPDGSGAKPRLAERNIYNSSGLLTEVRSGTVAGYAWADFTAMSVHQRTRIGYDGYGRPRSRAQLGASGTAQHSLVQVSYDQFGRRQCEALRMNAPTTATPLPPSACTPMAAGSVGPDRITQWTYDAVGKVATVRSGVGTALEQITVKNVYFNGATRNGELNYVEDAKGNRTAYRYDEFGRVNRVAYPTKTAPHSVNWGDDERLTYDANGNVATFETRRNETLTLHYDNLNRLVRKVVPERPGLGSAHTRDIYFEYDLFGNLTKARFNSLSGPGLTFAYDALGRMASETASLGQGARTVSYAYDTIGHRTQITHPDGQSFIYQYDSASRPTYIRRGSDNLALIGHAYDAQGRLSQLTRYGSAPEQTFGYDAAGRLDQLNIIHAGSNNAQWNFAFNPAGQVTSETRNNDAYAWGGHANLGRAYTANALNQYTAVGGVSYGYDTNGNLTSDGASSYVYDVENRLVSANFGGTANLYYDPLGRLYRVDKGGGQTWFLYDGSDLIAEYNASGTMLNRYVHGTGSGDDPLVAFEGASLSTANLRYLYADRLGSIILTTGRAGDNVLRSAYDEYGISDPASAGVGAGGQGRFGYTGQTWIPEIGMYHYKARAYSPTLGRFMQTDPIGYGDGMNMYAYVRNDPVNGVDPTGLAWVWNCVTFSPGVDPAGGNGIGGSTGGMTTCGYGWDGTWSWTPGQVWNFMRGFIPTSPPPSPPPGGGPGPGPAPKDEGPQNDIIDDLLENARDLYCSLPTLGISGSARGYAVLGGGVAWDIAFDPQSGRLGYSAGVDVGVGVGGAANLSLGSNATAGRNVANGWSASVGANANARLGPLAAGASSTLVGREGPGFGGVSAGIRNGGTGATLNGNLGVRGGYGGQVAPACGR